MNKQQQRPDRVIQNNPPGDNVFLEDAKKMKGQGKELLAMTEEKRMIRGMPPDVKEFFLEFKKHNPGKEGEYYKAFVSKKKQEIQKKLKEEENEKRLEKKLAQKASFWLVAN